MLYDRKLILQGKDHGTESGIGKNVHTTAPITGQDLCTINRRYMGAGMSQNYAAIYWFEYFYEAHRFEYVVEFGSQKGALSTYFANMAAITEQFFFETHEFDKDLHWFSRPDEGAGHWYERLAQISPYINTYDSDIFGDECYSHVKENMEGMKTFIFADGGDKVREFHMYAPLLKPGDRIAVHDWDEEIRWEDISDVCDAFDIEVDTKWATDATNFGTLIMPFKLKD